MTDPSYDLIIIGAGPAGLTAALYAGRYKLKALLLEKLSVGGQIILSPTIENFPGFPGGISTQEFIERLDKQVEELDVERIFDEALSVQKENGAFTVRTNSSLFNSKSIIVASGAQSKKLGIEGESLLIGRGVSYCGTCDGPFFKNKDILVVGGGDRAIEEAIFLTGYASKVSVIHRRGEFRASQILLDKAKVNPKIKFILNSQVTEINGKGKVESVKIKTISSGVISELPCQGVFVFVGIEPNTGFLKELLKTDERGFIVTDEEMHASQRGIFACGDCRKKKLYQVVNACGEAAVASSSAHGYLLNL